MALGNTEPTQGTVTYQEVCEEIGKLHVLKTVAAMRKKAILRDRSFPHCLFLAGEDVSQQTDRNQLSVLRVQEPLEIKDTTAEVFPCCFPPPYRHSLPLLQDGFSAKLELLLRGRKVFKIKKKKNNKSPIRSRLASNKFKSPNNLPLQTSGAWQRLDDLLRQQEEMCSYLKISPELRRQPQKHKIFLPSFLAFCLLVCLSFFLRKGRW